MSRTPLQPTILNKAIKKELELFKCRNIVGGYFSGQKKVVIQHAMDLPYLTINTIIERYKTSTTGTTFPWSERPNILSGTYNKTIHFAIKQDSFMKTGVI